MGVFPSLPSFLLENCVAHCKKTKKTKKTRRFGYLSFNYLLSYFFFNFITSQLIFVSNIILILLIIVYLVLNYLSSFFFFQFHPFVLGFYTRLGIHFFNCDVFDLESFIELICLWNSSFDILFLYQIWFSFFILLFLVVFILY